MPLKQINFSNSIRSENIQSNFEYLQDEINYNRHITFGHGIANGLNMSIDQDNYTINISHGSIIDEDGNKKDFDDYIYNIDLSDILQQISFDAILDNDSYELADIPYAINGKYIAQISNLVFESNNDIVIESDNDDAIEYHIDENNSSKIIFDNLSSALNAHIQYYIAKNLIYTAYINSDNNIQICKSIASTSPSEYVLTDYKAKIGSVFVEPNVSGYTKLTIIPYSEDRVNIYTENNILYINGQPMNMSKAIQKVKPQKPQLYDFWFNDSYCNNQLMVYKENNSVRDWYPVSEYSYSMVKNKKTWFPENTAEYNNNLLDDEYFIFGADEQYLYYEHNTNSIEIIIDNTILHSDQYIEVTASDLLDLYNNGSHKIKNTLSALGYTEGIISSLLHIYDSNDEPIIDCQNKCVGFKLLSKVAYNFESDDIYKRGPYVEAIVTHSINTIVPKLNIQNNSSYVYEQNIVYTQGMKDENKTVFDTNVLYKYNECQIEVFINGRKLANSIEFEEIPLQNSNSNNCREFKILTPINVQDIIICKINKNVYSYRQLENCNNLPRGTYSFSLAKETGQDIIRISNTYDINSYDYLTLCADSSRKMLIQNIDYNIEKDSAGTYIRILNSDLVLNNDTIHITGIKFAGQF